jgi:hypothetical protein
MCGGFAYFIFDGNFVDSRRGDIALGGKMKNRIIYLCFALIIVVSLPACSTAPTQSSVADATTTLLPPTPTAQTCVVRVSTWTPSPFEGSLLIDKFTSQALEGNLMGNPTEREFFIYLPSDYATSNKRYPVVYVLHGANVTDGWLVKPVRTAAKKLLIKGDAKEMIYVFPDATNKLIGATYMSSIVNGDFETYITKELVEKVDSTYRTIPNRDSRAITGCSMGGMGALHLGLKYPDIYGVVVPMNGQQLYEPFMDLFWKEGITTFSNNYADWSELGSSGIGFMASQAMIAAPNPDNPPFYFDMPYKIENGKTIIDPVVYEKIMKLSVSNDIDAYLSQPMRLNNLYIFTSDENGKKPLPKIYDDFDNYLTTKRIPHDFTMIAGPHCTYDLSPVIKYLSDHLVFE